MTTLEGGTKRLSDHFNAVWGWGMGPASRGPSRREGIKQKNNDAKVLLSTSTVSSALISPARSSEKLQASGLSLYFTQHEISGAIVISWGSVVVIAS